MPDLIGAIIGNAAILGLWLLYRYADDLGDGNIERVK